jgi:protein FRG1
MSSSGVVSKKLKFKGDKVKKKRKVHKEEDGDEGEFAAMAAADPKGGCSSPRNVQATLPEYAAALLASQGRLYGDENTDA